MNEFLKFVNDLHSRFPVHMEIYLSRIMDWNITIYKQGCAKDYPNSAHDGDDAILVQVQNSDMEFCFAAAHVMLKEWLIENCGGY